MTSIPAVLYPAIHVFIFIAVKECSPVFQLKLYECHASYLETFKVYRKHSRLAELIYLLVGGENAEVRFTKCKDWYRYEIGGLRYLVV